MSEEEGAGGGSQSGFVSLCLIKVSSVAARRRAPPLLSTIETHVAVEAKLDLVHVEAVAAPFDVM
jgi:hypothetical protein